jgi:exodeoxyribonuclease VII large subunit
MLGFSMPALVSTRDAMTVGELTRRIRKALEDGLGRVWVEGEISNLRQQSSGHQYFSLKDAEAQIRCVWFRGQNREGLVLRDGMQVQIHGDISVYEAQGQYQLVVRIIQPKGVGELQAKFEALKRRLDAEGLFRPERKRPIPKFPRVLALVTSPTGAAVRDMLHVLARRAPWVRVLIHPVRVQGDGAHEEIAAAIQRLGTGAIPDLPGIDTLIVARGGGSIEDLWNFNEESVARAIAACPIPVISGVGHEIDFTICDFVADLRAPTPSAAAELAVPDQAELLQYLDRARGRLDAAARSRLEHWNRLLDLMARSAAFREPGRILLERQQRLDDTAARMQLATATRFRQARDRLDHAGRLVELSRPDRLLGQRRDWLRMMEERLDQAVRRRLEEHKQRLEPLGSLDQTVRRRLEEQKQRLVPLGNLIRTLGPESVLQRGYSLTTDTDGNVVSSAADLRAETRILTRFRDGTAESTVTAVHPLPAE